MGPDAIVPQNVQGVNLDVVRGDPWCLEDRMGADPLSTLLKHISEGTPQLPVGSLLPARGPCGDVLLSTVHAQQYRGLLQ